MKIIFPLILLALLLGTNLLSYRLGRSMEQQQPYSAEIGHDLDASFENFLLAQRRSMDHFRESVYFNNSPHGNWEAYLSFLHNLVGAVEFSAFNPDENPYFVRIADLESKSGMDNPDNEYFMARFEAGNRYRIWGKLTSGRQLHIQAMIGEPGVGAAGPGKPYATLSSKDITYGPEGAVELIAGADDDAQLKLPLQNGVILLRLTDQEWGTHFIDDVILIEEICDHCPLPSISTHQLTTARVLNRAAQSLTDRTNNWLSLAKRVWRNLSVNSVAPVRPTPHGLTGQYSAWGKFDLGPEEALIVSVPVSNAQYQGIQLASRWFVSLDYRSRQTSLNGFQAHANDDGYYRFILAHRDPGYANWLDLVGHKEGLIFMRWQGLEGEIPGEITSRLIAFSDLADHLPADMKKVSREKRQQILQQRRRAVDIRFH